MHKTFEFLRYNNLPLKKGPKQENRRVHYQRLQYQLPHLPISKFNRSLIDRGRNIRKQLWYFLYLARARKGTLMRSSCALKLTALKPRGSRSSLDHHQVSPGWVLTKHTPLPSCVRTGDHFFRHKILCVTKFSTLLQ